MLTRWNSNLRVISQILNDENVNKLSYSPPGSLSKGHLFHERLVTYARSDMMVTLQKINSIRLDHWFIVVYFGLSKFSDLFEKDVIKMVILL